MPLSWSIEAEWEPLDTGPAEERACFAQLGILAQDIWLTEGIDRIADRIRQKPLLSAYHLAEWMAWNWWRLRWEPRAATREWSQSHLISTIGSGYIWPNITVFSDGERIALIGRPTAERTETPFRYISDFAAVVAAGEFEAGLDEFFDKVLNRLDAQGIKETNFHSIWQSLSHERATPELAQMRKLEALVGADPDEAEPDVLGQMLVDLKEYSSDAVEELAASRGSGGRIFAVAQLKHVAAQAGYDTSPRDTARLPARLAPTPDSRVPAWRQGAKAAMALREQERLGTGVIADSRLAGMVGVSADVLGERQSSADLSFAIDASERNGRIVLRSKWHDGRRFELARLLGDRISAPRNSRLFPATRSYTYRQKMQRAFAAEFLSPFETVDEMLAGDYSVESQKDVANHFQVSELTIRTLLVNHGRLEREELGEGFEDAAA